MSKLSFTKRLWIQLFLSLICLLAVALYSIVEMRAIRIDEREEMLAQVTDTALSLVKYYASESEAGRLPIDQAKAQALSALKALRYGNNGYFAIADENVNILMHAFLPKLEHTNAADTADSAGVHMWADGVRIAQGVGQGYVRYVWPKPGVSGLVPKIAYVAGYKPWGWTLLTGVYIDDINEAALRTAIEAMVAVIILMVIMVWLATLINRSLKRSLGGDPEYAVKIVRQIAQHDLSSTVVTQHTNDQSLLHSMRTMQMQLVAVVTSVKELAESISSGSSEIAAGNINLSQRTEEQAAALQETAASMEQLHATVGQTDESAVRSQEAVQNTLQAANAGRAVIAHMVESMTEIDRSSNKIAGIADMIQGIAFQTNILSLNAAVEAARAGDQGRGFSVVASEVRALAQRSSAASKEIAELISNSKSGVEKGSRYAKEAGDAMSQIESTVQAMTNSMLGILAATREQSTGIGQINRAISEIDKVTQQNAALVEQVAAAANALESKARGLQSSVSSFKLPID
ncbi:methyl-accepting chemotaxis protein [Paraburkholderia caribensis]|uniref:methyl-accepting chemotaxis protein n=1 Tax=Paraburkholderia caribensis TaxID=75105 RepID=UPI001591879E|nr:methyl-accepting chemotaxis protein [Paraburkholderia caribensis]